NNVLIADTFNDKVRRVNVADGTIITYAGIGITGYGGDGGAASAARFFCPTGVISDAAGRVYVADRDNHRVRVVQPVPAGDTTPPVLTLTQPTSGNTFTATASPLRLTGGATDNSALLAVQWANDRGGSGLAAGTSAWTIAAVPLAIGLNNITITAYDLGGNTATLTLAVTFAPTQLVTTLAGNGTAGGEGDGGAATLAQLLSPRAVAVDARGNVYVADATHRVRRITPNGQIVPFAGNGIVGNGGDNGLAVDANLNQPRGLAVDSAGNVYLADTLNNRVRKVTVAANGDGRITTIAGTGIDGNRGDGGLAVQAELSSPTGVALDSQGNVYIADTNNQRVRKVTVSDGKISTVAGNGEIGFSGDGGPATQAQLFAPVGVALDAQGNLYFIDQGNQRLRRVAAGTNTITTIAGTGNATFNGDDRAASSAALNEPRLLAVDAAGDVYIADQGNQRIRKVSLASGMITTVAGSGAQGFGGDNSAPSSAVLSVPQGVAVDAQGNIFIADTGNHRVRKVQAAATVRAIASVSAASYAAQVAPDSIVAAFGERLAPAIDFGVTNPLPVTLAGVSVRVRDSFGIERLAPLFFVSPGQINYLVPSGTAEGIATVTISAADGALITGVLNVVNVAPGLFTANGDGQGVPTALTFRVKADGSQTFETIARFDAATNRFVATPIDLGPESDQVFLILYGTGLRGRSALTNVTVRYADLNGEVFYVGESPGFIGLDQVNVRLPRALFGRGDVNVTLTADGRISNTVRINVK
ncbi:MAG: hypothetical protein HOP19_12275, partial [Acidobacteria bacterium]|nr:hypothetical protein [Acidobacteriota bacterium]